MLEFTGLGSVLRTMGVLYWLLAGGAVVLALSVGRDWRRKSLWTAIAVAVFGFLPGKLAIKKYRHDAYAREAWAYFKKKCETEAGEKIYQTFTGVKSVLVIKPLPPATEKDLYDQFWYGDPYSDATPWGERGRQAAGILVLDSRRPSGPQRGLEFVEMKLEADNGVQYQRITRPLSKDSGWNVDTIQTPVSRFGVSWEDISTADDRKYWVAGSRLRVIDLIDNSIVGERVGYLIEAGFGSTSAGRRPWLAARGLGQHGRSCPDAHDYTDQWFITNVLKQGGSE